MASSADSLIDNLLACRIVNGPMITIPGFADLNESQQAQIIARLQQEEREGMIGSGFDPQALTDALSNLPPRLVAPTLVERKQKLKTAFEISSNVKDFCKRVSTVATEPLIDSREPTPPAPSKEENFIEAQSCEILARQDLEADGCPPCYPPNLTIPLQNIPEKYQKIISYWQSHSCHDNQELLSQFWDWDTFREFQRLVRRDYGTLEYPFSVYVDLVRKRRQTNGLGGDVPLRFSLEENNRKLEDWIEFQAYHIRNKLEPLEKKIRHQKARMASLQEEVDSADATASKKAARIMESNQGAWKYQEQQLEMERYFLEWTEQQRIEMGTGCTTPDEVDRGDRIALSKAIRKASISDRRKRQPKACSVLGKPRISKRN